MTKTMDIKQYQDLGSRLGEEIGNKLVAKLGSLASSQSAPRQFRGGVDFADLTREEATQLVEALEHVGEYADGAATYAAANLSMEEFVESRLRDTCGMPFPGCVDPITDAMITALAKQSAKFAAVFPVRSIGIGL